MLLAIFLSLVIYSVHFKYLHIKRKASKSFKEPTSKGFFEINHFLSRSATVLQHCNQFLSRSATVLQHCNQFLSRSATVLQHCTASILTTES